MRIISVETAGFGPLPDGRIELDAGLTVIQGPNEAGKSFMMRAINQGLYGDASTSSKDVREAFRKWNMEDGEEFRVSVRFEHEGEDYLITRDFGDKKNLLAKPDGREEKDKGRIAEFMAGVIGLPSLASFESTACIPQEDVEQVSSNSDALREIIEERLAGSGADTDRIIKKVQKKAHGIRSKNGKAGELVEQQKLQSECQAQQQEFRSRVDALGRNRARLIGISDELAKDSGSLEVKTTALEGSEKYIKADEKYGRSVKEYDLAEENLRKFGDAKKALEESSGMLEGLRERHAQADAALKAAGEHRAKAEVVAGLEKALGATDKSIAAVRGIDRDLDAKKKELAGLKEIAPEDLRNVQSLPGEIAGLEQALEQQVFALLVDAEAGREFSITADGKAVEGSSATAHGQAVVEFAGVGSVSFKNETGAGEPIADEISRKKAVLADILGKYEVEDGKGLAALDSQRQKTLSEIKTLESRRSDAVADGDLEELAAHKRETQADLDKEKSALESLAGSALSGEELGAKKAEMAHLSDEIRKNETTVSESQGVLKAVGDDEAALAEKKKDATREMVKAEEIRDEFAMYKCDGEEYESKAQEVRALGEKIEGLKDERNRLQVEIDHETLGEEDVSRLEEQLEMAGTRIARLEEERQVLDLIIENIEGARHDSIARFSSDIETKMAAMLDRLTGGRYTRVRVDGNLRTEIFSTEKDEWIDPVASKHVLLSTGALDQVFLAARFALLELLTGERTPPVILDDTFVAFDDMGRKQAAFDILGSQAQGCQVLYFTCHNVPEELNVLNLEAASGSPTA